MTETHKIRSPEWRHIHERDNQIIDLEAKLAVLQERLDGEKKEPMESSRERCVVANLRHLSHDRPSGEPGPLDGALWVKVAWLFGLGSHGAIELCRKYGFDPHEQIGGVASPCEGKGGKR